MHFLSVEQIPLWYRYQNIFLFGVGNSFSSNDVEIIVLPKAIPSIILARMPPPIIMVLS